MKIHTFTGYLETVAPYFSTKISSSWLNCALRDDETVYWISRGHILNKVEIWTGITNALLTDSLTDRL